MADDTQRSVTLDRLTTGVYEATNARGGTLRFGSNAGTDFTPVELLLAAIGGCTAVDVDVVTGRRTEAEQFRVTVAAEAVRSEQGNILRDIEVRFQLRFPAGDAGDHARALVPRAISVSHDRTCTVSRTIEAGAPVRIALDE